jgi:hypothetical protein
VPSTRRQLDVMKERRSIVVDRQRWEDGLCEVALDQEVSPGEKPDLVAPGNGRVRRRGSGLPRRRGRARLDRSYEEGERASW